MTNHPNRAQSAHKQAYDAGYFIIAGAYRATTDNRIGRWYIGHKDNEKFYPYGPGFATKQAAWEAALEHAKETGRI